jgi:hypothetical protein
MRQDENGDQCPSTLGEYRDLCNAIGGENCEAVRLLDGHIAKSSNGRDEVVIAADSQMRFLLMPLLSISYEKPINPPANPQAPSNPSE